VELVSPLATDLDEPRSLQHLEVLGNGLSSRADAVPGREKSAEFEEGLAVSFGQLVENRRTGGIGKRLEEFFHGSIIRKPLLAYQGVVSPR